MTRRRSVSIAIIATAAMAGACARRAPIAAPSVPSRILETQVGLASYYGAEFHGKTTASGRPFDMHALVAAHPRFPFGTLVKVTNLANGRSVQVRVQDRGPARQPRAEGVIIDLSQSAAERLGFLRQGRTRVRLEVLEWAATGVRQ
jgi:rare lipoprotein A